MICRSDREEIRSKGEWSTNWCHIVMNILEGQSMSLVDGIAAKIWHVCETRRDERSWLKKMLSREGRAASTSANANSWDERRSNIYQIDHHEINDEKQSGKWIRWSSHAEQRVYHDSSKEEAETSSSTIDDRRRFPFNEAWWTKTQFPW